VHDLAASKLIAGREKDIALGSISTRCGIVQKKLLGERLAAVIAESAVLNLVSENIEHFEGDGPDPDAIVLFTFPSMAAIDAFVSDADYRPYRTARRAASSGNLFAFAPCG